MDLVYCRPVTLMKYVYNTVNTINSLIVSLMLFTYLMSGYPDMYIYLKFCDQTIMHIMGATY